MANPRPRSFFDTDVLQRNWSFPQPPETISQAVERARRLASLHRTEYISSPTRVEFLCGISNARELKVKEAFINSFRPIDQGSILPADWVEAVRVAKRFGNRVRTRKLGDCLIKAISVRFKCDIITFDKDFTYNVRRPTES